MEYSIREKGVNGSVEISDGFLVRTIVNEITKNDEVSVPLRSILGVELDSRLIRTDVVTVTSESAVYEWKIADDAPGFVHDLRAAISSL